MFTYSGKPLTPVHDEIDFEFLGRDPQNAHLTYFRNGARHKEEIKPIGSDGSQAFHHYAFLWLPGGISWYIDGKLVRSVRGADTLLLRDNFSLACGAGPPSKTTGWASSIQPKFPRLCTLTGRHIRRQGNSAVFLNPSAAGAKTFQSP